MRGKAGRQAGPMSIGRSVPGLLAALALAACAPMKVQTDFDRQVAFNDLSTYEWVESGESFQDNGALGFDSPLMARRIQTMVHAELASLGYRLQESGVPDFGISYRMLAREEVEEFGFGHSGFSPYRHRGFGHGGHGFGHGGHGFGHGGYGSGHSRDVVLCVLVLDVWDPRSTELVWRGWARWHVGEDPSAESVTKHLHRAVREILSQFPPEAAGKVMDVAEG